MSFEFPFFSRITSSGNDRCFVEYGYKSESDTLATIKASAYFNDLQGDLNNGDGVLKVGDVIVLQATDGHDVVTVTSVSTNVTVAEFPNSDVADGSITTAKLADGAVTLVKVAALTLDGTIAKGYASGANEDSLTISKRLTVASGSGTTVDPMLLDTKSILTDVNIVLESAGVAGSTVKISSGSGDITNTIATTGAINTRPTPGTWDTSNAEFDPAGLNTLNVTRADGGSGIPGLTIYFTFMPIA